MWRGAISGQTGRWRDYWGQPSPPGNPASAMLLYTCSAVVTGMSAGTKLTSLGNLKNQTRKKQLMKKIGEDGEMR